MSVLIDGTCLVIPRDGVDASEAAPVDALIASVAANSAGLKFACVDEHLICIAFADAEEAERAMTWLRAEPSGTLVATHDHAIVDSVVGPVSPCDWLECIRHASGHSYAWLAGTDPGDLSAPAGWAPTVPMAGRFDPDRARRLSSEAGVETWLDYETGELFTIYTYQTEELMAAPNFALESPPPNDLYPIVAEAVENSGYRYLPIGDDALRFTCYSDRVLYDLVIVGDARRREIVVYCVIPTIVPAAMRPAVAEFVARVNYGLRLGNFELDMDRGNVRYKTSVDVMDMTPTPAVVHRMLSTAMGIGDIYVGALHRVLYGNVSPEDAVRDAEAR